MRDTLDPTADRALYRQLADALREEIVTGEWQPGAPLPSERFLVEHYGMSRGTVREAVNLLKVEGLIDTRHGRGAFVRDRRPVERISWDRFDRRHRQGGNAAYLVEMEQSGREPGIDRIEIEKQVSVPPEVAKRLELQPGEAVTVRRRRYLADGEPMQVATSYIPWELASGTPILEWNPGPGGIYARLEEQGYRLDHFTEEVTARMPTPEEARALRMSPGVPVVQVVRVAFAEGERPVEMCDTVMRADRYVLHYRLPAT